MGLSGRNLSNPVYSHRQARRGLQHQQQSPGHGGSRSPGKYLDCNNGVRVRCAGHPFHVESHLATLQIRQHIPGSRTNPQTGVSSAVYGPDTSDAVRGGLPAASLYVW